MLQSFFLLFCLSAFCLLLSLKGENAECPVELNPQLNPQRVLVKYGSSVSVDCSTNVTHDGMGWEASEGSVPLTKTKNLITWTVKSLTRWDIQPQCFFNYNRTQCESFLSITIYKIPDSVSISTSDHSGPMTEGSTYKLQCDVVNVAPVQNLTVKWYQRETLKYTETFTDPIKSPMNKASILQITADRSDDGAQYRCEAELELGAEGPHPPPIVTSKHFQMTVTYKPQHIRLVETIEKIEGEVSLNCTVAAIPSATYTWHSQHLKEMRNSSVLSSSTLSPGNYTCTAKNYLGDSRKVFIINSAGDRSTVVAYLLVLRLLVALKIFSVI